MELITKSAKLHAKIDKLYTNTSLIIYSIISVFPIVWILFSSFKEKSTILLDRGLLPQSFTFQNYINLINEKPFLTWFGNSIIIAVLTTLIGIFFAATAAYAFSQFRFPGRRAGLIIFLFVQMFPGAILLVSVFNIMNSLGLINNIVGLVLAYSTVSLPFCVWMLKSFFDTIPHEITEAAKIDGLSHWQLFYKIIFPLSLPGIAVTGFFSFITSWNEFMFANVLLNDPGKMTLPVGMKSFVTQFQTEWHYALPASILVTIPVLIFFIFAQKWLVSGLTAGAVKG